MTHIFSSKPPVIVPSSRKFVYQPVVNGGAVTLWGITGNPAGMTINTSTGVVEWTPLIGVTTSGAVTIDADGDTQVFTLTVDTPPRIVSTPPDVATNGNLFNYQAVAVDGETLVGVTWSVVGFPAGMTIGASTGLVAWTPSSTGTFHFTVKIADATGLFDAQLVTVVVS